MLYSIMETSPFYRRLTTIVYCRFSRPQGVSLYRFVRKVIKTCMAPMRGRPTQDRKTPLIGIKIIALKILRFDRKAGSTREVSNIFEMTHS